MPISLRFQVGHARLWHAFLMALLSLQWYVATMAVPLPTLGPGHGPDCIELAIINNANYGVPTASALTLGCLVARSVGGSAPSMYFNAVEGEMLKFKACPLSLWAFLLLCHSAQRPPA